jgi:hypothetical protein
MASKSVAEMILGLVVNAKPDKGMVNRLNLQLERAGFRLALYWKHGLLSVGRMPPIPKAKG